MEAREEVEVLVAAVGVAYFDHFDPDIGFARFSGFKVSDCPGFGYSRPETGTDEGVDDVDLPQLRSERRREELLSVAA